MFTKPGTLLEKDFGTMKICAKYEFQSKFPQHIPVVIEIFGKKNVPQWVDRFKFLVPYHMTVSQFIITIRDKLDLSPYHDFHLLLKKNGAIVMMSQYLGSISSNYKDKHGCLHFTLATENIFGCPRPQIKGVRSKFPGEEPTPFGAPDPEQTAWVTMDENESDWSDMEEGQAITPSIDNPNSLIHEYLPSLLPAQPMVLETGFSSMFEFQETLMQAMHQLQTSLFLLAPQITQMHVSQLPPYLLKMYPHFYVVIVKLNQILPYSHLEATIESNHVVEPISMDSLSFAHYIPLVYSLHELVKALESQLHKYVVIPNEHGPQSPATAGNSVGGTQSSSCLSLTLNPVHFCSHAANSLTITNDFLETLHQNLLEHHSSDMMVGVSAASGPPVHPAISALVEYFDVVRNFLQNNQVLTVSNETTVGPELQHFYSLWNLSLNEHGFTNPYLASNLMLVATISSFDDSDAESLSDDDVDVEFG